MLVLSPIWPDLHTHSLFLDIFPHVICACPIHVSGAIHAKRDLQLQYS